MNITFRAKLFAIFGAALLTLFAVLVAGAVMGVRQTQQLDEVQGRLVPKAELAPRVDAELERMTRAFQDAVAAQDPAGLEAATERRSALFDQLNSASGALDPSAIAAIRWAVQDYYTIAYDVSRRLIAGESGEALPEDVARMQALQRKAQESIKRATVVDRHALADAFGSVRRTSAGADRLRIGIAGAGVLIVAFLALWGGQGTLQALQNLVSGLARFGTGDFRTPIPVATGDELGLLAAQANKMADSLAQMSEARERDDRLKAGVSGLGEQLRGDLEPGIVAERTLGFLVEKTGALAGALYLLDDDGSLVMSAGVAHGKPIAQDGREVRFAKGEGLVGQAFNSTEPTAVRDVPADYWKIKSGLGEMVPKKLYFLPLAQPGRAVGVLELALPGPLTDEARTLLLSVRALLVVAIDAAQASAGRLKLLHETQAQAERLTAQEEELRLNNQELLAQQEELRRANVELEMQGTALARQNDELAHAQKVLAEKAEELNRVSSYKSQFLANMSHELRTPLNSMLLLSQLLAENEAGNLTPKQVEHLRTVHSAGHDLLSLINEVLDLSKIEAGKQEVTLELVELTHLAAFTKRLFEATAAQKGLKLEIEIDAAAPPSLFTDRQRLERILLNLLSNALKFTQRGHVRLRMGRPTGHAAQVVSGDAVAFAVSDTGIGIPEAARERVFAPFEQVEGQSNRGHAGTGLGLPIARESARLLGGDLLLDRSSGAGSTFVCVLPERAQVDARVLAKPAAPVPITDDAAQLAQNEPHLLIIEDDPVLAEQLIEIAHARHLKVVVVGKGADGLRLAGNQTVGIVLDVKLPDTDGWSVMERLKQDPKTRSIPVHFVSGVDQPQRGLALGAVGYLVKPASHSDLARVVRTLVPTKPAGRGVLVVEDNLDQGRALLAVLQRDGFAGAHVQSAEAALQKLSKEEFGCVILDLGLPDMDGLGLLKQLRARPDVQGPRVVIHTGRSLSKEETRELEAYAEAIVLKDGRSAERLLEEVRLFVRHVTTKHVPEEPAPSRSDAFLRGVKLLLAEDDMRTIYSLSALLRGKGAEVVTAETGAEALTALSHHTDVRAVLMDIMMPEMDGYEAMRRLRKEPRFARLPVIALTAKAMKGERERCLEAGASDYLPKPIDGEKLLATLQRWLEPGAS